MEISKKSILMLTCQYMPDVFGGAEKQCRRIAAELSERGHQVTILSSRQNLRSPAISYEGKVKVIRIYTAFGPDLLGRWSAVSLYWFSRVVTWAQLNRKTFDLIHCHQGKFGGFAASCIANLLNKPLLIKIGNSNQHMDLKCLQRKAVIGNPMTRYILKTDPAFVAISSVIKNNLKAAGAQTIVNIPNGISTDLLKYRIPEEKDQKSQDTIQFFFHGRLEEIKRIPVLIQAFSLVSEKLPQAILHLIGTGSGLDAAKQQVENLKLSERVIFHGKVDNVIPLISTLDVFVNASEAEGFSNSLLEALLLNHILVSTPVSGATDAIIPGSNGYIAEDFSPQSLAKCLLDCKKILSPSNNKKRFKLTEKLIFHKFSMPVIVDQYEKLYELLLRRRKHESLNWNDTI